MTHSTNHTLYQKFPYPKKIAILRALNLGDLLCTVPAFRALRSAYPEADISLIGLAWAKDFVHRFSAYIDEFIEFPGFSGLPEQRIHASLFTQFLLNIQKEKFDLIIQMQGNGRYTNQLMPLLGARHTAGFYTTHGFQPELNTYLLDEDAHEILRFTHLLEFLGIAVDSTDLVFPLFEQDRQEFERLRRQYDLDQPYVIIHAGTLNPKKRWRQDYFAEVANLLIQQNYTVVLTGTHSEKEYIDQLRMNILGPVVNLAGKTSLGSLGMLIDYASLLICNDTGVSHIAAALKVPSIVIFSPYSDPQRWAPLDKDLHSIITAKQAKNSEEVINEIKRKLLFSVPSHIKSGINAGVFKQSV